MNILGIGCHPDDLEITCYGTLAKYVKLGHNVAVCHVANGNLGHVEIMPDELRDIRFKEAEAAAKVIGLLNKDSLTCNPCVAHADELLCNGCSQCQRVCPYGAISYMDKEVRGPEFRGVKRVAVVNGAVCQGCGACTVTCPSMAMDLKGFKNEQIFAEVDAICR